MSLLIFLCEFRLSVSVLRFDDQNVGHTFCAMRSGGERTVECHVFWQRHQCLLLMGVCGSIDVFLDVIRIRCASCSSSCRRLQSRGRPAVYEGDVDSRCDEFDNCPLVDCEKHSLMQECCLPLVSPAGSCFAVPSRQ